MTSCSRSIVLARLFGHRFPHPPSSEGFGVKGVEDSVGAQQFMPSTDLINFTIFCR